MEVRGQLVGVSSFHHVEPRDQNQFWWQGALLDEPSQWPKMAVFLLCHLVAGVLITSSSKDSRHCVRTHPSDLI